MDPQAFSQSPLSRAYRPFIGSIFKARSGSIVRLPLSPGPESVPYKRPGDVALTKRPDRKKPRAGG